MIGEYVNQHAGRERRKAHCSLQYLPPQLSDGRRNGLIFTAQSRALARVPTRLAGPAVANLENRELARAQTDWGDVVVPDLPHPDTDFIVGIANGESGQERSQ